VYLLFCKQRYNQVIFYWQLSLYSLVLNYPHFWSSRRWVFFFFWCPTKVQQSSSEMEVSSTRLCFNGATCPLITTIITTTVRKSISLGHLTLNLLPVFICTIFRLFTRGTQPVTTTTAATSLPSCSTSITAAISALDYVLCNQSDDNNDMLVVAFHDSDILSLSKSSTTRYGSCIGSPHSNIMHRKRIWNGIEWNLPQMDLV